MGRALWSWRVLVETGSDQRRVDSGQTGRLSTEADNHVDVVGGPDVCRLSFDLVKEHHLTAHQQPVVTERGSKFDKSRP